MPSGGAPVSRTLQTVGIASPCSVRPTEPIHSPLSTQRSVSGVPRRISYATSEDEVSSHMPRSLLEVPSKPCAYQVNGLSATAISSSEVGRRRSSSRPAGPHVLATGVAPARIASCSEFGTPGRLSPPAPPDHGVSASLKSDDAGVLQGIGLRDDPSELPSLCRPQPRA